jgi:hypothetical protein
MAKDAQKLSFPGDTDAENQSRDESPVEDRGAGYVHISG